ncbi:exonuclease domain-containing protein [Thalassotalea piscium]|uniref:DNA polymerase-3 subunit epsilon n=1 Tax=Thalassotalea piscium TaxID=1230533 RepID=A0A7X0NEP3_9GAMM|nr:exonuclease domain-containing protein [Thalassotalea piscium]MBB6542059.1 DNA polymerase-3 subunit epsilon [Thalassotalea piscium]
MYSNHFLLHWLMGYEAKRKRTLAIAPEGPLKHFLSKPLPPPQTPLEDIELLSVDFETTGLDAVNDKLLSVGFVEMTHQQIALNHCYHKIINTEQALTPENVIIHQITDDQKAQGAPLKEVIDDLLYALTGKIMVVHFARIERQFLRQACLEVYGVAPPLAIIDTLVLAKRKLDKRDVAYDPSELRLGAVRQAHQLPEYYAHNALNDAVATAELLLAQLSTMSEQVRLKELLL